MARNATSDSGQYVVEALGGSEDEMTKKIENPVDAGRVRLGISHARLVNYVVMYITLCTNIIMLGLFSLRCFETLMSYFHRFRF